MTTPNPLRRSSARICRTLSIAYVLGGFFTCLSAQELDEEVHELSPFTVESNDDDSWVSPDSISGTRVATRNIDLPFSVNNVTSEFLSDFSAETLDDQFAYVSGFSPDGDVEGTYQLRGFRQENQLRNGFTRLGLIDRVNVERAEVIKGPAAAIYGRTDPGGIINIVTKQPGYEPAYDLSFEVGEENYVRTLLGATGPVADKLYYRFDLGYLEKDAGIGFQGQEQTSISGAVRYQPNQSNSLKVEAEYLKRDQSRGRFLLPEYDPTTKEYTRIPWEVYDRSFLGKNEYNNRDIKTFDLEWDRKIGDSSNFRIHLNRYDRSYEQWIMYAGRIEVAPGDDLLEDGQIAFLEPVFKEIDEIGNALQADFLTQFDFLETRHKLLVTLDYSEWEKTDLDYRLNRNVDDAQVATLAAAGLDIEAESDGSTDLRKVPSINVQKTSIAEPDFRGLQLSNMPLVTDVTSFGGVGSGRLNRDNLDELEVLGLFVSERFTMFDDRLLGMVGARYDEVESQLTVASTNTGNKLSESYTEYSTNALTYQLGLNFKITEDWVLYGNRSTSFQPQTEFNDRDPNTGESLANPEVFDNEKGSGWEAGIKASLLDSRLGFTFGYFDLKKENVVNTVTVLSDEVDDTYSYKDLSGLEESSGFELDFNFKILDGWQIMGAYADVDAEIVEASQDILEGLPPAKVPDVNYGIASKHTVRDGKLKGLFLTWGMRGYGDSRPFTNADARALIYQPGYELWESSIGYNWKHKDVKHTVQLTAKNLMDEQYVRGTLIRGEPRRLIFRYRTRF